MDAVLNISNVNEAHELGKEGNADFNCWGETLFSLGYSDTLCWVNGEYMTKWLNVNTIVIPLENMQRGDILVLWQTENKKILEHTAVYVGKGIFFHKRGSAISEFATMEHIKEIYWEGEYSEIRRYVRK